MTASRKPRTIVQVTPYVRPDGAKRCKVELEGGAVVALHDLTRPELQRAAAVVFPEIAANVWLRFKSEEIQALIRDNDHAAAAIAVAERKSQPGTPAPAPADKAEAKAQVEEAVEDAFGAKGKTPAEQLAELIEQLSGKGGVDMDTLKSVVKDEVDRAAAEIRITRVEVQLPDRKVDLPDLHHKDLPKLIAAIASGVHLFVVGPAGTGKSTAAQQAAEALGRGFYSISFGPTTPTSKLFGYNDANGNFQATPLYEAYRADGEGGVFLGDELDNGHPGLLAEQNQFLSNGHCAFACGMVARHQLFSYVATGNTYGRGGDRLFVGRNQLDAATLDRFVFFELGLDEKLEEQAALRFTTNDSVPAVRAWIETVRKVRAQAEAAKLPIVISPRASIDGAKLITSGAFTRDEVVDMALFKGLDANSRSKLSV